MNIENKKQFITILLAVGLGLVAAFLTSQYVQGNIKAQTKQLANEYAKQNAGFAQEIERLRARVRGDAVGASDVTVIGGSFEDAEDPEDPQEEGPDQGW